MPQDSASSCHISAEDLIPRHIAIIMDGNGRWAKKRHLPRVAGHKQGAEAVRGTIKACIEQGVKYLTLFAFSSENWRRPEEEVTFLMQLFVGALEHEIAKLNENEICFKVIGDLSKFDSKIVEFILQGEELTANNTRLVLTVAANYGGRWDIVQAVRKMMIHSPHLMENFKEADLSKYFAMSYAPDPDLFIRTGGECRVSNFLLWQLAYSELYFTDTLWPDFDAHAFNLAIKSYQQRERRFGRISEQLQNTFENKE